MPRRALAEHRPYLLLSLLAGVSYYFAADEAIGGLWLMAWKGLGVGFLALYAGHRGQGRDGTLLMALLTLCAIADVVLEISYLVGGALFAAAHVVAIALYLQNRRERMSASQKGAAMCLAIFVPIVTAMLTYPLPNWLLSVAYAVLIGAMAAAAWTSRFPRYRVGIGAVLFVVRDLLIFAREAGSLTPDFANLFIWPIYFVGQFLIATGVVQTIRKGRTALA